MGERIDQVMDLNLTSTSLAGGRAATELRDAAIEQRRDDLLLASVNCGQELYDVVSVTDPQAGLEAAPRRVLGLSWHYALDGRARYEMSLELGNR